MGNNQSVRATHFSRSEYATDPLEDDTLEKHHINISNKMVERLVEDATLVAGIDTGASNPKGDYKEKILIEKLRCMDDSHSERSGSPDRFRPRRPISLRFANCAVDIIVHSYYGGTTKLDTTGKSCKS
ncbi:unnamed protein product, partial [Brenthis ino]